MPFSQRVLSGLYKLLAQEVPSCCRRMLSSTTSFEGPPEWVNGVGSVRLGFGTQQQIFLPKSTSPFGSCEALSPETGSFLLQVWAAVLDVQACYYLSGAGPFRKNRGNFSYRSLFFHILPTSTFMVGSREISPLCPCSRAIIGSKAAPPTGMYHGIPSGCCSPHHPDWEFFRWCSSSGFWDMPRFPYCEKQGGEGILALTQVWLQPLCTAKHGSTW